MKRFALSALGFVMLAACQPQVPDSGQGVGFESYSSYLARRDGQTGLAPAAQGLGTIAPAAVSSQPLSAMAPATGERPRAETFAGIQQQSGERVHYSGGNSTGISDEQNFDAVASRESIQSDAARIQQNRANYVVVQPTALPTRTGASGPNIVAFAVSTSHAPGTQVYSRSSLFRKNYEAACGQFPSADAAQEAFLSNGGPQRDKLGVDPDGDGFACGWDPRPFRAR
ncbi:hypothetical protein EP867_07260 [Falsigemmobacter intermedius]|uniref:Excalibur calcium-binding domain-containing protein n=1 Tax=Falsigemmobacter intermedius TaxID=1553448 RepID=A0A3S4XU49_9RHOB|nr:hypothetical protein [Falsigemmobacter intermedius]RWY42173.1 hypothetical protein EP867_07260 [Falsigemmobacter intermedius]